MAAAGKWRGVVNGGSGGRELFIMVKLIKYWKRLLESSYLSAPRRIWNR